MTHQRRATGIIGVDITFTDEMKLSQKKDELLSNSHNKQMFVNLIGEYLQRHGCVVHHARGDADLRIVTTALQWQRHSPQKVCIKQSLPGQQQSVQQG